MSTSETIVTIIAAVFTFLILMYLFGDNVLYRLGVHLLIGVGAAFAVAVALTQVLVPNLLDRFRNAPPGDEGNGDRWFVYLSVLGIVFLLFKLLPRVAWIGNVAVGYIIGVGVGVAVGGALIGTLIPQTLASVSLSNLLILISTVLVLFAFTYARSAQRGLPGALSRVGRAFLYVALGATFALVFIASAGVLSSLVQHWTNIIAPHP